METQFQHLTITQHNELLKLWHKFKELFDGILGNWGTDPVYFGSKEDEKPIYLQSYPVQKVHDDIFKKGVERLVLLGILEVANDSEWVSPYFAQPKPKSERLSFLSDFRNLNKQLKRETYPMPKINDMLLKLYGF